METDEIEKARIAMYGYSELTAQDKYNLRTTNGEHAPDCNCSICQSEAGYEIGMG